MKNISIEFGPKKVELKLPDQTEILAMSSPEPLSNPRIAIDNALDHSIGSPGLDQIIAEKLKLKPDLKAALVISDNTRPVPYKGETGILWPVINRLLSHGITKERIQIIVATGTHRALSNAELQDMLDARVFEVGIPIINHNCKDQTNLMYLGETSKGSRIYINSEYMKADLKILTGLVESHFMAGVSGGRKSVCPGLVGEESTYIFHSALFLASPKACDLNLDGNPCHEEALEVAEKAKVDYIVNVTLDRYFNLTGVFAGDLKLAHNCAVAKVKSYTSIPITKEYDIVITHAGFVGKNHYQAAKAAVGMIPALKTGGTLIEFADNTDINPVGSLNYHTLIHLLKILGAERFNQLMFSPDWCFIPEQWQVQKWSQLFQKIPLEKFIYYSPQLSANDYNILPGKDGNLFLPEEERYHGTIETVPKVIELILEKIITDFRKTEQRFPSIAFFTDGPYGVPVKLTS